MISPASLGLDSHFVTIFFKGHVLPHSKCFRRHRLSHLSRQGWGGEYEYRRLCRDGCGGNPVRTQVVYWQHPTDKKYIVYQVC